MMKPDASKSAAIATFEALCNFWRTFRWLVDTRPKLRTMVATKLISFVKEEKSRWGFWRFLVFFLVFFLWGGFGWVAVYCFMIFLFGVLCIVPFSWVKVFFLITKNKYKEITTDQHWWKLLVRHKDQCPDLGALLVLFTVLQGDASCPKREEFLNHYADAWICLRWFFTCYLSKSSLNHHLGEYF